MLSKLHRLSSIDIRSVRQHGLRFSQDGIELFVVRTKHPAFRCVVLVPKRTDAKATHRNRMRRLVYETIRLMMGNLLSGQDVVITVRKQLPATRLAVEPMVKNVFSRARLFVI